MSGPERERPDFGRDREARLRQLLNEAVEPVEPAPGAQARLFARIRAREAPHRSASRRWAVAGSAVATAAVVAVGAVLATGGSHGSSSSTSSAGSAAAVSSSAAAPSSSAGRAELPLARSAAPEAAGGAGGSSAAARALPTVDLDGDGVPDALSLQGSSLTAELSRYGTQTVRLPEAAGVGAAVTGFRRLATAGGGTTPVAFVRLFDGQGAAHYAAVVVSDGRLALLQRDGRPAVLSVSINEGFSCDTRGSLAFRGNSTPYVVSGDALVPAPQLYAVSVPAGVAGCVP